VLLAGGLLLASSTWGSAGRSSEPNATDARSPAIRSPGRALHDLAAEVLLPRDRRAPPHEDLRRLRSELASLATEIGATQRDPSPARLQALGPRRRAAEDAFRALRDRIRGAGAGDLATDLEALFAPLWSDVDEALGSAGSRAGRLASARARVEAALAQRSREHGSSFTALSFDVER
jgi:hypothetical protein